jgi:hypothetical protein
MDISPDPRIRELKRLQLALNDASRHLDELEARLLKYLPVAGPQRRSSSSECGFAAQVAIGLEKIRHKQAINSAEPVGNGDF